MDTKGKTDTATPGVGAHQSHLGLSDWHHEIQCSECHIVPTVAGIDPATPTHLNGANDLDWGPIAGQGTYDPAASTCSSTYCHGSTLNADAPGQTSNREPIWTAVDGSQAACGTSCHTLPPGGGHPAATNCEACHTAVITSFSAGNPPTVTWADPGLHIDGKVDLAGLTCTTCHGDAATNNPAPPVGTNGETATTEAAVGAHTEHLSASGWHRQGQCTDCHAYPNSTGHSNGVVGFSWGGPSNTGNPGPNYAAGNTTCTNTYCHGTTLGGPNAGGAVSRAPDWTLVDGTYDGCGTTCHTNPPGGTHPVASKCETCHNAVVSGFVAGNPPQVTWNNANLHVDGQVQRRNLSCTSCHGDSATNNPAPPDGVGGETATNTLAVGRHVAHLTAGPSHIAFACSSCHSIPGANDIAHTVEYVASSSLDDPGHHGDVVFSGPAASGMTFDVNDTQGNPVTARGSCLLACHSDGRGNPPNVTPYWAGGSWNTGDCGSCHDASPNTRDHGDHRTEAGCATCHPSVPGATHVNGERDVRATMVGPNGGGVTTTPPGSGSCGNRWTCNGTCHGSDNSQDHQDDCW